MSQSILRSLYYFSSPCQGNRLTSYLSVGHAMRSQTNTHEFALLMQGNLPFNLQTFYELQNCCSKWSKPFLDTVIHHWSLQANLTWSFVVVGDCIKIFVVLDSSKHIFSLKGDSKILLAVLSYKSILAINEWHDAIRSAQIGELVII